MARVFVKNQTTHLGRETPGPGAYDPIAAESLDGKRKLKVLKKGFEFSDLIKSHEQLQKLN